MNDQSITAAAVAILKGNDQGGYTVPTKGLYPFQWNWDSAFVALGFATFDPARAWTEIETLLSAQWPTGMVPHIVFWQDDTGYFPGSGEWNAPFDPPTSGITQPPVAASVIAELERTQPHADRAQLKDMIVRIDRWHAWFSSARDPQGTGLVAIIHPWESGRDNLPDWDRPLSFVDTSGVGEYHRRDTDHINPAERPQKADYDRYMALVQFGRNCAWDDAFIARDCPFFVADVGMNAILRRAERDLVALARNNGLGDIAAAASARLARLDEGFERLWSDTAGGYVSLDLRRHEHADALSAGAWLAFYGGPVPAARASGLLAQLDGWRHKVRFLMPSFDPTHPLFDSIRYWRGPVWAIVNYMLSKGFADHGQTELSEALRTDTAALIRETGFYEYFCPLTGKGGGGSAFSWTAAMWLAWAGSNSHDQGDR